MSSQEISIKQLPIIDEINTGDLMLVQTPNATSILDFDNFVIGIENTSFGPTISGHTTKINELSSVFSDNFFTPGNLITNANRFVMSGVNDTNETTVNPSGVTTITIASAGNAVPGVYPPVDTLTYDVSSTKITTKTESLETFQPAFLPIDITFGGTKRTYYFVLSAAGAV